MISVQTRTSRVPRSQRLAPTLVNLPSRTMAVFHTIGDPNDVGPKVIPALYGAVYTLKFNLKKKGVSFTVEPLRARWSSPFLDEDGNVVGDPSTWKGAWGMPIPDGTASLAQKSPDVEVTVEKWDYGDVAQILHEGPYKAEFPTIQRLRAFILDQGYDIVGPHEEEYLTRPTARIPRTIIRYAVRVVKSQRPDSSGSMTTAKEHVAAQ